MSKYLFFLLLLIPIFVFSHENENKVGKHAFIKNEGQWHKEVLFKTEVDQATIYFTPNGIRYQYVETIPHAGISEKSSENISAHFFKAEFKGANKEAELISSFPSSNYFNYFIGNDESKWKSGVKSYKEMLAKDVYPDIDVRYYYSDGFLKYDFIITPNANAELIKINYKGVEKPKLINGDLYIEHAFGTLIEKAPLAYQNINGKRKSIEVHFQIDEEENIHFVFPNGYDKNKQLIIDPLLVFSTFSGAIGNNFGMTATYDDAGNGYMGGTIFSNNYDTLINGYDTSFNGGTADIAISKFNDDGTRHLFSTFIGGEFAEAVASMVVNSRQELIIMGISSSRNFPITQGSHKTVKDNSVTVNLSGYLQVYTTGNDIILSKFSPNGKVLLASSFFGGNSSDGLNFDASSIQSYNSELNYNYGDHFRGEITVDDNDTIYIGTSTHSSDLDTNLSQFSGLQDGIIAKFSPNIDQLIWSRYLGGGSNDAIYSLKITDRNQLIVGGGTNSLNNFPTTPNTYGSSSFGGRADGFITLLSKSGNILFSSYLGTNTYDQAYFVESDRFNNLYAFGQTNNTNHPVINAPLADTGAGQFIIKLDSTLSTVDFSHTFGNGNGIGRINISPTAFLVDRCLNVYVSGWGGSLFTSPTEGAKTLYPNMPLTKDVAEDTLTDGFDFYFYVINRYLDTLVYASYLGGTRSEDHVDGGTSRFSKNGIIYQSICASCYESSDFPTTPNSAFPTKQSTSNCNNALYKYDFEIIPVASFLADTSSFCLASGDTVAVTITDRSKRANEIEWNFYGTIVQGGFQNDDTTIFISSPGEYLIEQIVKDTVCATDAFTSQRIYAYPDNITTATISDTLVCYSDTFELIVVTSNANKYSWSRSPLFDTLLNNTQDSIARVPLRQGLDTFYVKVENTVTNACVKFDTMTVFYEPVLSVSRISDDIICQNTAIQLTSFQFNVDTFLWDFGNGFTDGVNKNTTAFYPNPGDYVITFTIFNQLCDTTDVRRFNLNVRSNDLIIDSLFDTLYCGMDSLVIEQNSFGTAETFLWSSQANYSDTLNNYPLDSSFTINNEGQSNYYIKINDQFCEKTDTIVAKIVRLDLDLQLIDDSVCTPYSTQLQTTIIGTDSFRINYGQNLTTTTDTFPITSYNIAGSYIVELLGYNDECGYSDTIEVPIRVFQGINLESIEDTVICRTSSIELKINSNGTASSFIWSEDPTFQNPLNSPSDSSILLTPTTNQTLYYKGVDGICEADSFTTITLDSVLIETDDFTSICIEDTINLEARILFTNSSLTFDWQPKNEIISGDQTNIIEVSPSTDQIYSVTATNTIGCNDIGQAELEVNLPAFTDAIIYSNKDSTFVGEPIQLSTNRNGSNLTYNWSPSQYLDNSTSAKPIARPLQNTTFYVTITDQNTGCEVISLKRYSVFEINCAEPDIFIPSAFTPNNDGNNDIFYFRGDNVESLELSIYNRWGEQVFRTEDKNIGWDGNYKGRPADPAVFVYQLKAVCFDGQEYIKKGNFTLIR